MHFYDEVHCQAAAWTCLTLLFACLRFRFFEFDRTWYLSPIIVFFAFFLLNFHVFTFTHFPFFLFFSQRQRRESRELMFQSSWGVKMRENEKQEKYRKNTKNMQISQIEHQMGLPYLSVLLKKTIFFLLFSSFFSKFQRILIKAKFQSASINDLNDLQQRYNTMDKRSFFSL